MVETHFLQITRPSPKSCRCFGAESKDIHSFRKDLCVALQTWKGSEWIGFLAISELNSEILLLREFMTNRASFEIMSRSGGDTIIGS